MFMDVEASHKGRWTFTQDRAFDINDPACYPSSFSGNIGTGVAYPVAWNPSFYVQDTWQVTSNLTLNLGLRYDLDNTPTTVNEYVDAYNARIVARLGGAPPLQKSVADKNNFAPRLGVVWVPTADRKTTLAGQLRPLLRPEPLELHRHLPERDAAGAASRQPEREHPGEQSRSGRRPTPRSASRRCARFWPGTSRAIRISAACRSRARPSWACAPDYKIPVRGEHARSASRETSAIG